MWCGGARGTHWATCHNRVTPSKTKEFSNLPAFLDLNGMKKTLSSKFKIVETNMQLASLNTAEFVS